jgi:CelD/BcsL family acetyltransferase involved in cellulose biosynthesis
MGPLRFEFHSTDGNAYRLLRRWKTEQYHRSGLVDVFSLGWTESVFEAVLSKPGPSFSGSLSTLYAGDVLAAVHLGLHTSRVLHWWYPSYNRELKRYSPGLILLLKCLEHVSEHGFERLDFGKDSSEMKMSFMTGDSPVAEGSVALSSVSRAVRKGYLRTRERVRSSPVRRPLGRVYRSLRSWIDR